MRLEEHTIKNLVKAAYDAQASAYSPYSGFCVGAALLAADGTIYKGCNIENASYSVTVCAERTALFKAVSEGVRSFEAIAVVGNKKGESGEFCAPCGICRQALAEFGDPDELKIILGAGEEYEIHTLREMLPFGFTSDNLK